MIRIQGNAPSLLVGLSLFLMSSAIASATSIVLVGQDDPLVDRPALQAAIDAAPAGATIELVGTFQLDGERVLIETSRLTLAGRAIDSDGDGSTNEDWADGLDNDGDGLIDEDDWDAVLRGVADPAGGPATVQGDNALWNRALVVEGISGTLRRLTIRDIRFSGHHRAVELIPEWGSPTGGCDDRFFTGGSVRRVRFQRNRFDGNILGVLALGAVKHVSARWNLFEDHGTGGFFVEGTTVDCPLADGTDLELALATPLLTRVADNDFVESSTATFMTRLTTIVGNRFSGGSLAVLSLRGDQELVRANTIAGSLGGIVVDGGSRSIFFDNTIIDSFFGIDLFGVADRVLIARNHVAGAFWGMFFEPGAQGFKSIDQTFESSLDVDILLDFGSLENTVINNGPAVTVTDFGTDNVLIGNFVP